MRVIQGDDKDYIVQRGVKVIRSEDVINYDDMTTHLNINNTKTLIDLFTMGDDKMEVYAIIDGVIYMIY